MVLQFQKQCLELSKQALESEGSESRDMTTFTFAVSKSAQAKVEKAAEKFKAQVRQIVMADNETPTVVEHVNLHVFSNIRENNKPSGTDEAEGERCLWDALGISLVRGDSRSLLPRCVRLPSLRAAAIRLLRIPREF
jgi:hypothetical protein